MSKASPIQQSFNSGELSPYLEGRTDLAKYASGCRLLENFVPMVQGPAVKRSGTRFVAFADDYARTNQTIHGRLVPFIYSKDQSYVLEFGLLNIKFYRDSAPVLGNTANIRSVTAGASPTVRFTGTAITAITAANPPVVTATNHGLETGDKVWIQDAAGAGIGMVEVEDLEFTVAAASYNTFELDGITGAGYTAYTGGAEAVNHRLFADGPLGTGNVYVAGTGDAAIDDQWWPTNANGTTGVGTLPLIGAVAAGSAAVGTVRGGYQLTAPWTAAQFPEGGNTNGNSDLQFAQSADVIYIASPLFAPRKLTRFGDADWFLEEMPLDFIPLGDENTENIYLQASAASGAGVTITVQGYPITGATSAFPVVVTCSAGHLFEDGDTVTVFSATGMTELNGRDFEVQNATGNTFELNGEDGTIHQDAGCVSIITNVTLVVADSSKIRVGATITDGAVNITPGSTVVSITDSTHIEMSLGAAASSGGAFTADFGHIPWSGTGTVARSVFLDVAGDDYFALGEVIEANQVEWLSEEPSVPANSLRYYDGNVYSTTAGGTAGISAPIHTEGSGYDGGIQWDYLHSGWGYGLVTGKAHNAQVTVTVVKRFPESVTPGGGGGAVNTVTRKWAPGAWSPNNYPRCIAFFEERLWFAANQTNPQTLWASQTGYFENYQIIDLDESAITITLNSETVNDIEWMAGGATLQVGTVGGEFTVGASNEQQAVTPGNVRAIKQSSFGSRRRSTPIRVSNVLLFVQRAGRKLRELVYDDITRSYLAPDLMVLSEHLTRGTSLQWTAYAQEPNRLLWALTRDNALLGFTYERDQEVVGWHRHTLGGNFSGGDPEVLSIASIPAPGSLSGEAGNADQLWMIVRRTINGAEQRTIEILDPIHEGQAIEDSFFVDCGITYDDTSTTTISGLEHLEGESVEVLADGLDVGPLTVTSGAITLSTAASVVQVGLGYTATLQTMRIDAGAADGTTQGKTKRVTNLVLRLFETGKGLFVGPEDDISTMKEVIDLTAGALFDGDTRFMPYPAGYETPARITLKHNTPLPCTVVATMPQLVVQDR